MSDDNLTISMSKEAMIAFVSIAAFGLAEAEGRKDPELQVAFLNISTHIMRKLSRNMSDERRTEIRKEMEQIIVHFAENI